MGYKSENKKKTKIRVEDDSSDFIIEARQSLIIDQESFD